MATTIHRYSQRSSLLQNSRPSLSSSEVFRISSSTKRFFFWGGDSGNSGSNSDSGSGSGSGGKGKKPVNVTASEAEVSNDSAQASNPSALPTRLGFGDEAPRYPHLTALPVISRPLFPGIVTSVTVSDDATIEALEKIAGTGDGPGGYVGKCQVVGLCYVFLLQQIRIGLD